ncbi:tRNA/rRNA methyltransferase (SpoU) family protein [Tasmannia lanceolata]|uniref:tRNA/rRNA methyltransferase (SpoU) family protein n=1 Tax=Tasmannia lanceolata TaxID=3420 RepID=UPI0040629DE8
MSASDPSAMVSSLTKSFENVPSEAIPSIIDCILASTSLSPSSLFSLLLDTFHTLTTDLLGAKLNCDHSSYIISFTSALCYLIKNSGTETGALQSFIWRAFLPLLKIIDTNDYELLNQIAELLCDIVIESQTWGLMETTLVPFALRSVGLSIGMFQNKESSIFQWSRHSLIQGPNGDVRDVDLDQEVMLLMSGSFPPFNACHILTSLLVAALKNCQAAQSTVQPKVMDRRGSLDNFAKNILWDLSDMTVCMLSQCAEHRSCAIHFLLPVIFRALDAFLMFEVSVHGLMFILSREHFFRKIWECCKSLFSRGPLERQDAYSLLALYLSFLLHIEGYENDAVRNGASEFDVREEKEFWEEIRRGLVDKDALVRKHALHILKISLGRYSCSVSSAENQCHAVVSENNLDAKNCSTILSDGSSTLCGMSKRGKWAEKEAKSLGVGQSCNSANSYMNGLQRWEAFLLLYEMLEEFGTHLVEAAWTHQVSLLLHFSSPCDLDMNPVGRGLHQIQLEAVDGIFSWLAILWERGFCHNNPQVRCLIMQSFLGIEWENHGNCAKLVPESFVLGPFIQGLNDAVHHKDFGVKGVYSSKTIECARNFIRYFSSYFSRRERVAFLCSLASVANQESLTRAGFMALAICIASAGSGMKTHCGSEARCGENSCPDVVRVECTQEGLSDDNRADLLDALGIVIERSKQHFNPNYRLRVCEQVLEAAVSVMCTCDVPLDVLLHFLSTVPREFTDYGGSLRGKVRRWFSSNSTKHCSSDYFSTELHDLKNLCNFPQRFVKNHHLPNASITYDDEDLDAWGYEVQRWARVLFLVVTDEHHLEPIFMFLQDYDINICTQNHNLEWIPQKFLVLILGLVEELQIGHEKLNRYAADVKTGKEVGMTVVLDKLNAPPAFSVFEKFTGRFLFMLEKLVSYTESSCSIFWSSPMKSDADLPCSVRGKLGGPSRRRLASPTTVAVLQAILSVKTLAALSSWCAQLRNGVWLDSAFAYLWDFSWKVILSPTYESEAGAEIHLAAYEALVPVFKALCTAFSPLAFDLITAYNKSALVNEGTRPLLDPLVLSFLKNINDLLAVGVLTRSRRAVLMNWKWLCLDSLLSIPYYAIENGVRFGSMFPFFSDTAVRCIFIDLVESLENAGESSVLPILRSVRWVVGHLCSGRLASIGSSCDRMDAQMMWQLVHSSWILHVSCNKRRVAPIAALLSSVLHPSVFNDLRMHETSDSEPGPLKWFVEKILDEGMRSPRTTRLAALHLTGLWLLYPRTIKYYIKELKLLSLYGSVAFDEDFEAELTENRDAREEVSLLAQIPDAELTETFINTEMYARVAVAVLFYKLAELAVRSQIVMENEDVHAALHCGKLFLLELLDSVVKDKDLAKELYKKYSAIHRRKVRAWQMICVLSPFVDDDIVQRVTSSLHICLYRNNLPAVRQYLETFAIQIYLKYPLLIGEQLIPIFRNYDMKPQALSSYVFIAANVILHACEVPVQLRHLDQLLPPLIPFLTSHHHSLRGFTQILVYQVLCKLMPALNPSNLEVMSLERRCFMDLKSYLAKNSDCMRLRASMQGFLDAFDPCTSATPVGIFSARDEGVEFECVPISLMEQVITFLNDAREDLRHSMSNNVMTIKNESLATGESCKDMDAFLKSDEGKSATQIPHDAFLDFQKKITLYKHGRQDTDANSFLGNVEFLNALLEMETEDLHLSSVIHSRSVAMERIRESRQPLILVASLLDRIPNLAGLARTCEVFKVAGLTIADASVLHDKQFQLISVTAEKWVPIMEVPVCSLKVFLEKKKREGYSILGLEQTANSTPLDKYSFPKKTVLVLGQEKEGIPVDIIHILDECIEIPQLGVVRSLNVHVSGAIALWEYTRQQRSNQCRSV